MIAYMRRLGAMRSCKWEMDASPESWWPYVTVRSAIAVNLGEHTSGSPSLRTAETEMVNQHRRRW